MYHPQRGRADHQRVVIAFADFDLFTATAIVDVSTTLDSNKLRESNCRFDGNGTANTKA